MFKSARKKLTLSYIGIIMTITLSFSSIVYVNVNRFTLRALEIHESRVENRLREFPRPPRLPEGFQAPFTQEAILQIRKNTILLLISVNIVILLTVGGFGYWFAGRTLKPIEDMSDKQKKFIADAAHELKTPLTSIKTQLEVSLRNKKRDSSDTDKLLESVIEDVDSLAHLTNSLLVQSKYQENSQVDNKETFSIEALINEILNKLQNRIDSKNISVKTELADIELTANKKEITELVTILLDNAVKFNKESGTITISAKKLDGLLNIDIADTGIGMDAKDTPHIFDRFYKADTARTRVDHDGFGLGLAIAKDIVHRHNGKITLVSEINKGSTFTLTLPNI